MTEHSISQGAVARVEKKSDLRVGKLEELFSPETVYFIFETCIFCVM